MDDIIDLELEKIENIIAKIDSDPESEEVKEAEKHLWEKIYNVLYSMQSYAQSPDGGDGIIIASNYAVTLL